MVVPKFFQLNAINSQIIVGFREVFPMAHLGSRPERNPGQQKAISVVLQFRCEGAKLVPLGGQGQC